MKFHKQLLLIASKLQVTFYLFLSGILLFLLINSQLQAASTLDEPILPLPQPSPGNPKVVELGKLLFNNTQLSKDKSISCASCHHLESGGDDNLTVSEGINNLSGNVNTPTVFNSSFNIRQFWDGKASDLIEQIDITIQNPKEMDSNWSLVIERLKQDSIYVKLFSEAFPDGLTINNIKQSIVTFEKTLVTPNSRFDQYLRGASGSITKEELSGYVLFKQYGCTSCHQGMAIGGNLFQKLGIMKDYFADRGDLTPADFGRFNVSKNEFDRFFFKVPSLRNVELTAPYFHDGSVETLDDAVKKMMIYQLGIVPKQEDIQLIVQFLKTLTGEYQGKPL